MKFLVDEMFGANVAERLIGAGHDAVHVRELGLSGADDSTILARAADDDRVIVTENAADFLPLVEARAASGLPVAPVVIALKRNLPTTAGAMNHALVTLLVRWAEEHPQPYRHAHWLS